MTNLAIRVVGADHPGITADLMSTLAALGADLQDVEQVLVRQRPVSYTHLTLPTSDLV